MSQALILAIDQGTTSSRAMVFDARLRTVACAQQEFAQIYPADGWVEHDPELLWSTTLGVARQAMVEAERGDRQVVAIGIANQRETVVVWNRDTGAPLGNAIVWQDRRTADTCKRLDAGGHAQSIQRRTGLLLDPYFSATKIAWILDNISGARGLAEQGKLAFGTVDAFLIWRLTGGDVHATDVTNASRTSLYNIVDLLWDNELLSLFEVPRSMLPEVRDCAEDFGKTHRDLLGREIPILGVAGDQQAATIGQCCFEPGAMKATYGTGCFVVMNTGSELIHSSKRLLSTIAYRIDGQTCFALEGSIFVAGAAVQWLRDRLGVIDAAPETEAIAASLDGNHGVYLVPAFAGLGAPYWDAEARGALVGMTLGTDAAAIVRATLESVCYQTFDLFDAMAADGVTPAALRVDGGMVVNNWLMQFLSDVLQLPIDRPEVMETTALGAAYLAGRQAGVFGDQAWFAQQWRAERQFTPAMGRSDRDALLRGWRHALGRVLTR